MRTGEAEGGGRGDEGNVDDEGLGLSASGWWKHPRPDVSGSLDDSARHGGSDGRGEVVVMVDDRGLTDGRTA